MSKNTIEYWDVLAEANHHKWQTIPDTNGQLEQLTLAQDSVTGDIPKLLENAGFRASQVS